MLAFKHPGIYTREIASGVRTIAGSSTSVTLFIGPTRSGIDKRPIRLLNYSDFERKFGGLSATSSLSYSVLHFFANGGGEAFVMRLPPSGAAPATTTLKKYDSSVGDSVKFTALSSGVESGEIFIEIDAFGIDAKPFDTANVNKKIFNLTVIDRVSGTRERFGRLTTLSGQSRSADTVVNDPDTGSQYVSLTNISLGADGPLSTGTIVKLGAIALNKPSGNASPSVAAPSASACASFIAAATKSLFETTRRARGFRLRPNLQTRCVWIVSRPSEFPFINCLPKPTS